MEDRNNSNNISLSFMEVLLSSEYLFIYYACSWCCPNKSDSMSAAVDNPKSQIDTLNQQLWYLSDASRLVYTSLIFNHWSLFAVLKRRRGVQDQQFEQIVFAIKATTCCSLYLCCIAFMLDVAPILWGNFTPQLLQDTHKFSKRTQICVWCCAEMSENVRWIWVQRWRSI